MQCYKANLILWSTLLYSISILRYIDGKGVVSSRGSVALYEPINELNKMFSKGHWWIRFSECSWIIQNNI